MDKQLVRAANQNPHLKDVLLRMSKVPNTSPHQKANNEVYLASLDGKPMGSMTVSDVAYEFFQRRIWHQVEHDLAIKKENSITVVQDINYAGQETNVSEADMLAARLRETFPVLRVSEIFVAMKRYIAGMTEESTQHRPVQLNFAFVARQVNAYIQVKAQALRAAKASLPPEVETKFVLSYFSTRVLLRKMLIAAYAAYQQKLPLDPWLIQMPLMYWVIKNELGYKFTDEQTKRIVQQASQDMEAAAQARPLSSIGAYLNAAFLKNETIANKAHRLACYSQFSKMDKDGLAVDDLAEMLLLTGEQPSRKTYQLMATSTYEVTKEQWDPQAWLKANGLSMHKCMVTVAAYE